MRKKIFAVCFAAVLALCFAAACNGGGPSGGTDDPVEVEVPRTSLAAPTGLTTDGSMLRWNAVDNAAGYLVEYFCAEDDEPAYKQIETTETEAQPAYDKPGQYTARVRALAAEDSYYARSPWTDWIDYRTTAAFSLSVPAGFAADKDTVTWQAVPDASAYRVRINGGQAETVTAPQYTVAAPVPGSEYSVRVQAVGDSYYEDSDWSETYAFTYTVEYDAPSGLTITEDGFAVWDAAEYLYDGYTVSVQKDGESTFTDYKAETNAFDVTRLPDGDYTLKVKVNGGGEQYDSAYSETITVRVTAAVRWDAAAIAGTFTSWNYCTAQTVGSGEDAYASFRCGEGWGGLLSPGITVNYGRNPVFAVEYASVPYGYMGNYYIDGNLFTYAPDIEGGFTDETRHFRMDTDQNGAIGIAQGVKDNVQISIGFTFAPGSSDSGREVMGVREARVVYIEEIPVVPDTPVPLDAPEGLRFSGYSVLWNAVAGNSEYTPRYDVTVERRDGDAFTAVETLTDYVSTAYDLRDISGRFVPGVYRFRVQAVGDNLYFADSAAPAESAAVTIAVTEIDLEAFAAEATNGGHPSTPQASYADGVLTMTQTSGYGMLRYVVPETVDVANAYLVIDFLSVTGGNYYIRLPLASGATGDANNTNTIASNDSAVTGTFTRKLTDIPALSSLTGAQELALHMGLSGTDMTCRIGGISFVTVTEA